jgi:hypothetical protein
MTDRAAPKPKKEKKPQDAKAAPGPKLVAKDITPGIGHNLPTGEKNPRACELFTELESYAAQKKAIAKAERDARNALKSECGILASSVAREMAMRKLDSDVRVQVETNYEDTKKMTGYQAQLDFVNGVATTASAKAQAPEGKAAERDTEPKRDPAEIAKSAFHVADGDEDPDGEDAEGGVITREG